MSESRVPGRTTKMGIRLIAAILAAAMLLQTLPAMAFAQPAFDPLDLATAMALALGDEIPPPGEDEVPGSEDMSGLPGSEDPPQSDPEPEAAGIIVRMKETRGIMAAQSIETDGMEVVDASGSLQLLEVSEEKSLDEALHELRSMDSVEYAEPNYILRAQDYGEYDFLRADDPLYDQQWGLQRIDALRAWGLGLDYLFWEAYEDEGNPYDWDDNYDLDENEAKALVSGEAAPVVVAVIDTGVDAGHEDLTGRVLPGYNTISDNNVFADDSINGHGTHIAGIIAAKTNNADETTGEPIGIAGTAGEFPVSILPVKALDSAGIGTMYDVAEAIVYAADQGARVINLSLGARLFDYPRTLADAVAHAQNKGALVVAAAGNEGLWVDGFYPACLPGVIPVGATTYNEDPASFSNSGSFMLGPGEDILSTLPVEDGVSRYGNMTGTSQACAFVSGVAALILSVFPDVTQGDMVTALDAAAGWQETFDAERAIAEAYSTDYGPDVSIEFMSPLPRPNEWIRVAGVLDLTVKLGDPSIVSRVEFSRWQQGEKVPLDTVSREDITLGGYATLEWDSSSMPDGYLTITATSYDLEDEDRVLGNASVGLDVANGQTTGLIIDVVNPNGQPAAKALVTVHHIYKALLWEGATEEELVYEELWNGEADVSGRVILPASVATGGNDYFVTARGTNPAFFYWTVAQAPNTNVGLTAEGASTLEVTACMTDGSPLAGADVSVEPLGAALPGVMQPDDVIDLDQWDDETHLIPLVNLNASGEGSVVLSPGNYNVRVTDRANRYYLCSYNVLADQPVETVSFGSTPDDLNVISLVPDAACEDALLGLVCLSDENFPSVEEPVTSGQPVTVTSGEFGGLLTAEYREDSSLWRYDFWSSFVVDGGGEHQIGVGESLSATIEPEDPEQLYYGGQGGEFIITYEDAFGNLLDRVMKDGSRVYPQVKVLDDEGNELFFPIGTSWWGASWSIPEEIAPGQYALITVFDDGCLDPVESEPLWIEIKGGAPPDPMSGFTATFLHNGLPLSDIEVYMAAYADGSYYTDLYESSTDEDGNVEWPWLFEDGYLAPGDKIALIAVGIPDGWSTPLFVTETLTLGEPPVSLTIEVGDLHEVNLTTLNKDGEALYKPLFSVYRCDRGDGPIGLPLLDHTGDALDLLVEEGEYLFQASQREPTYDDDFNCNMYYLSQQVDVTSETPVDGLEVTLDASEASAFSVVVAESGDYEAEAIALYPPGITQVPVFGFEHSSASLYVSPGTYHIEGVMTRGNAAYPDGLWCYWLTKDDDAVLSPSTPYEWTLGDSFDGDHTTFTLTPPGKTDFSVDETVSALVRIEDGEGNRLVGMALNFTHLGRIDAASFSSIRVPGGGQMLVAHPDTSEEDVGAQTHEEVAPFIIVIGPDGEEVYRYKDSSANYEYLMTWDLDRSYYWDYVGGTRLTGGSTFFSGEYLIPPEAVGGDYGMVMELETGPEGSFSRTIDFEVLAAHAPPRLNALAPFTNAQSIAVTGTTVAGATVTLYSVFEGGDSVVVGTATADENGHFSVTASLPSEGSYEFTATSTVGDATSDLSAPVSVTVDRQPPGPVRDLLAEVLDSSHVRLTWSAPLQEDPSGIASYRVRRDDQIVADDITPAENLQWQDSDLQSLTEYTYDVRAVDRAGNEAEPAVVKVTTTAGQDAVPPTPPRNLAVFLSGFRVTLTWEPAYDNIGVTGYKAYRWVKGAESPAVTEYIIEDPSATSFSDPDYLNASTTYVYVVVACDAAGNESITEGEDPSGIPAAVTEVTTRALILSGVQWSAPRVESGLLDPDDTAGGDRPVLRVTAIGDASRACTATIILAGPYVNLIDDNPDNDGVYDLTLVEDQTDQGAGSGAYRGSVSIPTDTSRIVSISCRLSDNAGNSASVAARSLPQDFAGSLEITVTSEHPDSPALSGAELKLWSPSLGTGGRATVNGTGTYVIGGLQPGTDYALTLTSGNREVLTEETGLVVSGGTVTKATADAPIPATFQIRVLKEGGGAAIHSTVTVTHADGRPLAQGTVRVASGVAYLTYSDRTPLMTGTPIIVSLRPASSLIREYTGIAGARFVLGPDANVVEVTLPARPRASLSGKVTAEQDPSSAMVGATVSAYQVFEGQELFVDSTRTDASGHYSLDLYEGPVRLVVNHRFGMSQEIRLESPLGPNEDRVYDFDLPVSRAISLLVKTKRIGEPEFTMDMDWRVGVHLHLSVTNLGTSEKPKNLGANANGIDDGFVQIPDAEPGDLIRITADGRECGMTTDTVEVTLDGNCWAQAEVNLIEKGTLKARVRDSSGNAHAGLLRYAELFKVGEQGARFVETLKSTGETVTSKPLEPGTYSLVFHWAPLPSVINAGGVWLPPLESLEHLKAFLGDDGVAAENLTFTDDPVLDLGTVRVRLPDSVKPGRFRGVEGNDLTPNKYESGPGGIVTLRGSYSYEGGTRLYRPKLLFGIPYGAQLVPGSVLVTPLEGIEPRMATRPEAVELSFGDYLSESISGTVVYRVRMPDDPDTAVCEARMWAQYDNKTEDIVTVAINVPYVSIEAPSLVWDQSREVEVSGRATPFASVRVYDMNYFLAEARASASGTWKATVVLPDRGKRANHFLRAEVVLAQTDDTARPDWPSGAALTVSQVESKSVTLSWPQAQDEVGVAQYVVTGYLTDGSVGAVRTAFPSGQSDITLLVDDLSPGTDYSFKVEAVNASYNWSSALTCSVTTGAPDTTPPSWPGGAQLTASEVKFNSLRLTWPTAADNEGLKEYRISCSPSAGTLARPVTVPEDTNTLLVEGLGRGRKYAFQVEAIDTSGNVATLNRELATLQYDIDPPVWPTGAELTATALDTEVTLNWPTASDNVQVSCYAIYRLSGTNWLLRANGYGNSHTIKQLSPETTYSFRVEARDSSGNRVLSPLEITVTTHSIDRTPPQWESGETVEVYDKTRSGFRIRIPAPYDESGISHYAIKDHQTGQTYTGSVTYFDGLTFGQTYTYTVLAQDTRGNRTPEDSGLTFSVTVGPEDTTPPTWPAGSRLEIPEVSANNAEVIWTAATFDIDQTGLPSYLIQAKDGNVVFGTTVGQSITSWAVGQLQPGQTYTISVEAMDEWGNVSTNGPKKTITTPTSDTQAPRWPGGAKLEAYGMQKAPEGTYTVLFQWPQAMDFELHHYEITATDSQGQPAPSSPTVTQQTAWHMWGFNPGETYTVVVKAKDLSRNVSPELTATVVTPGGMSGASVMSLSGSGGILGTQSNETARIVSSAAVKVEYDEDAVRIESVTMQQSNGRQADFEPVGKFVYVLVPSSPFSFDVTFNKPERVSELRILTEHGAELGGPLESTPYPGTAIATTGVLKGSGKTPGKLYASYAATPAPVSLADLPPFNEQVERSSVPTLWGSSTFPEEPTITYDDPDGNSGSANVKAFVGGDPRMEVNIQCIFTQAPPGRGTEPSLNYSIGETSAHFEIEVPLDPAAVQAYMGMGMQGLGSQAWLPTPAPLVKMFGDTAVHGGLSLETLFSTVSGSHDVQNHDMDLEDLLLGVNPDCPAHHVEDFEDLIQIEKDRAKTRKIAECVVSVGSIALGIAFPGVGFAVGSWLAGKALSTYNQVEQDRHFQDLKNEIEADELCRPEKPERKKDLIADPTWIIDPSGYVYEVSPENRLEGVTAAALQNIGGVWTPWDATWYEQDNPLVTDAEGRYAWDVPEGEWKVSFEKEGYEPTESYEMTVPPPHTDVNISMVTTEAPSVVSVRADSGEGVDIVFDKYMRVDTVTPGTVTVTELNTDGSVKTDDAGAPMTLSGAVQAIDAVADPRDPSVELARHFRFVPDFPLIVGEIYRVRISELVESYTGLSIDGNYVTTVVGDIVVPVTGVNLSRKSVTLEVGATTSLSAQVIPDNATDKGVSWSSGNTAVATVTQSGTVRGVSVGTATITVTTDDGGYQDTCSVSVIERDSGHGPGTGDDEGEGPAPSPEILAEETHVVGPGQTTLSVMDGILVLEIPAGAFSAGTKLVIRRLKAEASPADPSLAVVASPTYEILVQGSGPSKPVTIRFMYCSLCLKGMDPRKLGVYREDDSNPGSYTYIGGVVDTANHTVTVGLDGFSKYVVLGRDVTFGDIANHWGRNEIEVLASRYLVSGVSSAEYQPDRLVTRAELAKMLVGMLALDPESTMPDTVPSSPSFTDVSPSAWYYAVVETASALGLIQGSEGFFRPNDPVTRQEMAIMLARALGGGYSVPEDAKRALPFSDAPEISAWAVDGVASAWYWGLMQGVGGSTFQPLGNATRAQAAAVVLRMLELKGLVSSVVTLKGNLTISEIGGRHFELVGDDNKVYVILPQTELANACLEEAAAQAVSSGVPVTVTGVLSDGPNVYMRGQIVKAILVDR